MANEKLLNAIRETNPWWSGKWEIEIKDRLILQDMKPYLKLRQIITVCPLIDFLLNEC